MGAKSNRTNKRFLKSDAGKPRPSLLDMDVLENEIRCLEHGASEYGEDNWKLGSADRYINALGRHTMALLKGEYIDKKSGLLHTSHIRCNAMFIEYLLTKRKGIPKNDSRRVRIKTNA